jgi:hypothetical protein
MAWFRFTDLTGRVYGQLTVIQYHHRDPARGTHRAGEHWWTCRCSCGAVKNIRQPSLVSGRTVSCGCYKAKLAGDRTRTHGGSKTREYRIWFGMLERCRNPKVCGYARYGGKGLTVCRRWQDFSAFRKDMGPCPTLAHSIDRKDGSKGYSLKNCRWATPAEQNRNTVQNHWMTLNGRTQCMTDWAKEVGIDRGVIKMRVNKLGWSDAKALTTPVRPMHFPAKARER